MRRIIFHAGFHKTGTTSLQQTLRANRQALRPHIRLVLRPGMQALCEAARGYSRSRDALDLGLVKYEAAALAERLESEVADTIFITSEDLSGHMPGRYKIKSYAAAAPDLMRALAIAFRAACPGDDLRFVFTTRAGPVWLRSCYAQHLRATRLDWDEAEYVKRYAPSADHAKVLAAIAAEIPDHPMEVFALEDFADRPLGLAEAVLDLMRVTPTVRTRLRPAPEGLRPAPDADTRAKLLAINRSDLSNAQAKAARLALMRGES
ncbi:hypothetical protein KDD17_12720 [Sulfitobacter albidus]|uniref:Sulfotransferase family protein n=1 Tax=Sulfitobacter albidus TaxID=2829501 RepID=A0A975PLW8_9RHOB|nr:hypothetical protein [Sulfitobacter albidus]QUJ75801.1 hypothetical protein KDD17_12720 [Sulfitobacter albidus]